jgi:hypothetical protein
MDALEAWDDRALDRAPRTIGHTMRRALRRSGIYIFLTSFVGLFYLSNASILLGHSDLGWHLAAGDLIRERGSIPFQDPWSFTAGDTQWYNLSWLWDVGASLMFQYTGSGGLLLLVIVVGAVVAGYLAALCLSRGASPIAVCIAVFLACVLYPSFATAPNSYLVAAPNIVTMLFGTIFYGECLKRTKCFWLPLIMILWVNLHGGFVLSLFIVGVFCTVALFRRDWAGFKLYSLTAVACFVAIFCNPLGWHIYDGVTATLGHFAQAYVTEWWSYYSNLSGAGSIPGIIYIGVFIGLELRSGKSCNGIAPEARLLSWLLLILGFYQFRYMSFFFIFSTLPLALHIDGLLPDSLDRSKIQGALLTAGIMGACALPLTFMKIEPGLSLPDMLSDQDALYLKTHFAGARVLNHWNVGGILIFRTRGAVPVFVDGRSATAYPDALLRDYFKLLGSEIDETTWDAVLEKYRIDAVLWPETHEQLRRFLVDKRGWREEYVGLYYAIYAKP